MAKEEYIIHIFVQIVYSATQNFQLRNRFPKHLVFDEKRLERPRAQSIEAVKKKLRKNRAPLQWRLTLKGLREATTNANDGYMCIVKKKFILFRFKQNFVPLGFLFLTF